MSAKTAKHVAARVSPTAAQRCDVGPPDRLLTVTEAAALLGQSPRTLYKWVNAGRVASVKVGRLLRFRRVDLGGLLVDQPALATRGFPLTTSAQAR